MAGPLKRELRGAFVVIVLIPPALRLCPPAPVLPSPHATEELKPLHGRGSGRFPVLFLWLGKHFLARGPGRRTPRNLCRQARRALARSERSVVADQEKVFRIIPLVERV